MNGPEQTTAEPTRRRRRGPAVLLFALAGAWPPGWADSLSFSPRALVLPQGRSENLHELPHHAEPFPGTTGTGPHKAVAVCNDCHTPPGFLGHWTVKGINGFNHGKAFTTGDFHEPIRIRPLNKRVLLDNCRRCHEQVIERMRTKPRGEEADCSQGSTGTPDTDDEGDRMMETKRPRKNALLYGAAFLATAAVIAGVLALLFNVRTWREEAYRAIP